MRVFTCTPVAFGGGADFFARDSGLLCKGFQSLGHECHSVMPLPARNEDQREDLIRTEASSLEDERWWKQLHPELVVLYAWGSPKYARVARAIRRSGAFLVLNQDNGGLISPLAGFEPWLREQWNLGGQGRDLRSWIRIGTLAAKGLTSGIAITDPLRAKHLSHGHVIACVSPKAADAYRKLDRIYRGTSPGPKISVVPHAVEPRFVCGTGSKQRSVVCVGRWDDCIQKRPQLLTAVITRLLRDEHQASVAIVGHVTPELAVWHQSLPQGHRERVKLHGKLDRQDLAGLLEQGQVFYSPSAFESFGIAAAEALCCGCSVVAQRSVSMASFEWFASGNSGTLANSDDVDDHVSALRSELTAWDHGERDSEAISRLWCNRLHADKVAEQILRLMREFQPGMCPNDSGLSE